MPNERIYLDYNATTPVDPRVLEAMLPYFHDLPGNAASRSHPFGWEAEEAVDQARKRIADLIGAEPKEIVFTSGATESDNLALRGIFEMYARKGNHFITLKTEHKAVLDTFRKIEKLGGEVTYLGVDEDGLIDLYELEAAIKPQTVLVAVMWANNETGVLQPIREIGEICASKKVLFFSDATQAVGKIPVKPKEVGVQLMAFSAHKMYGPKGVGALFVSRKGPRVKLSPQIVGGGHEGGLRSGTLNVPGIVGFGKAADIAGAEMQKEAEKLRFLRDQLENSLLENLEESYRNGSKEHRMSHVTNLSFRFVEAEALMMTFNQNIAVSSGSACTSASMEPSHVLLAMGLRKDLAHSSLRFSLGRFTSAEEIERTIKKVMGGVRHLRELSPIWQLFKEGVNLEAI